MYDRITTWQPGRLINRADDRAGVPGVEVRLLRPGSGREAKLVIDIPVAARAESGIVRAVLEDDGDFQVAVRVGRFWWTCDVDVDAVELAVEVTVERCLDPGLFADPLG